MPVNRPGKTHLPPASLHSSHAGESATKPVERYASDRSSWLSNIPDIQHSGPRSWRQFPDQCSLAGGEIQTLHARRNFPSRPPLHGRRSRLHVVAGSARKGLDGKGEIAGRLEPALGRFLQTAPDNAFQPRIYGRAAGAYDGIKTIQDTTFSVPLGTYIVTPTEYGTDNGISHSIDITNDALSGTGLVDSRDYYFSVTAYSFNPTAGLVPHALEVHHRSLTSVHNRHEMVSAI